MRERLEYLVLLELAAVGSIEQPTLSTALRHRLGTLVRAGELRAVLRTLENRRHILCDGHRLVNRRDVRRFILTPAGRTTLTTRADQYAGLARAGHAALDQSAVTGPDPQGLQ